MFWVNVFVRHDYTESVLFFFITFLLYFFIMYRLHTLNIVLCIFYMISWSRWLLVAALDKVQNKMKYKIYKCDPGAQNQS